jgi:hypothetical protein
MLIKNNADYKVLLPSWIFERAKDNDEFKRLLAGYMARYPHYRVKGIENGFALCERRD